MEINEFGAFLKLRSHWTQNFIWRSNILRLGVLEETITDMHLFSIADKFGENIITKKFNRREEGSSSGADWLWFVGEPGSWLPLLIQAKVVNPKTQNCQHLNYNNGEQRRLLLRYARQHSYLPLYCIYSYVPPDFVPNRSFDNKSYSNDDWACSFLSPKIVRMFSKTNERSQKELLKYCVPWEIPFCMSANYSSTKGEAAASAFLDIRNHFVSQDRRLLPSANLERKSATSLKHVDWENLDTTRAVRTELPHQICKWVSAKSTNSLAVPVSGISIISTKPIDEIEELKKQ